MDFGEKIKELREAKGMTQQNLADLLFVTRQTVSRWEGGSRYPDLVTAKNLADVLDTTVDTLMADDNAMKIEQRAKSYGRLAGKIETMVIALCVAISLGSWFLSCWWLRDCFVEELFTVDHWYFPFLSIIDIFVNAFISITLISRKRVSWESFSSSTEDLQASSSYFSVLRAASRQNRSPSP